MLRRRIAGLALRAVRWKAVGDVPQRGVLVGAPHTSNWDWVLTMLLAWRYGITIRLLVKQELFVGPLGWLLRRTGAVELDRKNPAATIKELLAESEGGDPWLIGHRGRGHPLARRRTGSPASTGSPSRPGCRSRWPSSTRPRAPSAGARRSTPRATSRPTWTSCATSTPTRPASSPRTSPRRGCARRAEASRPAPRRCGRFPGHSAGPEMATLKAQPKGA